MTSYPPDDHPVKTPTPRIRPLVDRFWAKVEKATDNACWRWIGSRTAAGYGNISSGGQCGRMVYAHRVSYEMHKGSLPDGLQIDHLCRNPSCVNPDHLEVVTSGENTKRGMAPNMVAYRSGVCQRGHLFSEHGYRRPNGLMVCRPCATAANARRNGAPKRAPKTSAFRGVSGDKSHGKWRARIRIDGTLIHLGWFDAEADAAAAYQRAAEEMRT